MSVVRDLLREKRQETGANIGNVLRRELPGFNPQALGFASLTRLLLDAADEIVVIAQKGNDLVWALGESISDQKEKLLGPKTVVIWARDDDGHGETRRADVSGARESLPDTTPIIFAIASECGEAWVIAGWRPETPADEEKLRKLRPSPGFEPHVYPERLSHKDNAPRSAKAVIVELFAGDREKEASAPGVAANSSHRASEACGLPQS